LLKVKEMMSLLPIDKDKGMAIIVHYPELFALFAAGCIEKKLCLRFYTPLNRYRGPSIHLIFDVYLK
jgi:hypothetical protein